MISSLRGFIPFVFKLLKYASNLKVWRLVNLFRLLAMWFAPSDCILLPLTMIYIYVSLEEFIFDMKLSKLEKA